jgi:hypothetical protein
VSSTDGTRLERPVVFHLHDTYPKNAIWIRKVHDGKIATLEDVVSHGIYVLGAQVKTKTGERIGLETDLRKLQKLPKKFLDR